MKHINWRNFPDTNIENLKKIRANFKGHSFHYSLIELSEKYYDDYISKFENNIPNLDKELEVISYITIAAIEINTIESMESYLKKEFFNGDSIEYLILANNFKKRLINDVKDILINNKKLDKGRLVSTANSFKMNLEKHINTSELHMFEAIDDSIFYVTPSLVNFDCYILFGIPIKKNKKKNKKVIKSNGLNFFYLFIFLLIFTIGYLNF